MRNITKDIAGLKRLCELICQANGGHTEEGGSHSTRARGGRNNDLEDFCSDVAMPRGLDKKRACGQRTPVSVERVHMRALAILAAGA